MSLGFGPPSAWLTATAYTARDTVFHGTAFYSCLVSHTSGVFATDLSGGDWELLADFSLVIDTAGVMLQSTYDPQGKAADAFARANHTGTQLAATISNFSAAADARIAAAVGVSVQPLDADLTSIAALATTSYGRGLLTSASVAALSATFVNLQTGTSAVSRTIQNKFTEILSVKDFGAVGDGVANDTAAIALAETARAAIGGELIFPPGTYLFDGQAINRATGGGWRGIGEAKLIPTVNNTIMIDITGAVISANSPISFKLQNLHFAANGKTGVTAVRETTPYYTSLKGLSFTGDMAYCAIFTGNSGASQTGWINIDDIHQRGAGTWVFQGYDDTHYIFNVNITNFNQQGTGASTWQDLKMFKLSRAVSVYFNNVNVASLDGGADGISMTGDCQGVFLNNVIIGWPRVGVHAQVGTDTLIPSYVYIVNCGMDQATIAGFDIAGRTWRIHNSNSTNGYLRGSTDASLRIRATATDIVVRDFLAAYMNHDGIKVDVGATKVILAGVTAENNNQNAGGNFEVNLTSCLRKDVIMEGRNYIGTAGVNATGQRVVNGKSSEAVSVNVTPAQTTAVTTAEDLMSYTIPAASLAIGRRVRLKAWGTTAANANTKTGRLFFGATNLGGWTGALNGVGWKIEAEVIVTGAATQSYVRETLTTSTQVTSGTATEAISGAIAVKLQGQNGTASAGDITCNGLEVEVLD
ncbi:hypothetical protein [Mesorhizobium sp. M0187]|uniref:glycosyl hydrolase family 28-related protein n=1 Tax=Mesorhizobium sp. M0187 TaxID=2956908 RepID=UPI00333996EE